MPRFVLHGLTRRDDVPLGEYTVLSPSDSENPMPFGNVADPVVIHKLTAMSTKCSSPILLEVRSIPVCGSQKCIHS